MFCSIFCQEWNSPLIKFLMLTARCSAWLFDWRSSSSVYNCSFDRLIDWLIDWSFSLRSFTIFSLHVCLGWTGKHTKSRRKPLRIQNWWWPSQGVKCSIPNCSSDQRDYGKVSSSRHSATSWPAFWPPVRPRILLSTENCPERRKNCSASRNLTTKRDFSPFSTMSRCLAHRRTFKWYAPFSVDWANFPKIPTFVLWCGMRGWFECWIGWWRRKDTGCCRTITGVWCGFWPTSRPTRSPWTLLMKFPNQGFCRGCLSGPRPKIWICAYEVRFFDSIDWLI